MGGKNHGSRATDRGSVGMTERTQKSSHKYYCRSFEVSLTYSLLIARHLSIHGYMQPPTILVLQCKRDALVSRHTVAVTPSTQLTALATQSLHLLAPQVANSSSATSASVANKLSCRTTAVLIRRSTPRSSQRPGEHVYTAGPKICTSSIDRGHVSHQSKAFVTMAKIASL
jgi:hypothetical protein